MSGEINGTSIIVLNSVGAIVGQGDFTMTFNGTPIDISNKSNGDNVTLLDGELSGKQFQLSGTIVYNDDAAYRKVRDDAFSGTLDTYTMTYVSNATTDESISGSFMPTGLSDALPRGNKVETSITFVSSGVVNRTPAA